ncbi:hypothetical protein Bca52824_026630 [Brassica carinata]|uniref:Oberon PHD finger domain-containing protein n=1 Tax=Brassica carinata TaxID=52824 RepID=A0A8X7SIX9_BRACI|nr:hypothetical protein Bca52824_026630 [Brassica carinata]
MDTKRNISQSRQNHQEADVDISNSWICKNASCRANVSLDDSYCKRCSCCVCHAFDENKDPTLWLVCESGKPNDVEFCGLSCHVECAFRKDMVWVNPTGNLMKVDGYFCCYSCGKVSDILGCWKKQLVAAKDARRIDVLCYRIELSYRLLDGTCRFSELHEIVKDAKSKLEVEVGPLDGPSARNDRGIVSRLPVAMQVQELSSFAIRRAEYWSTSVARDLIPAACRFDFEDVAPRQVILRLIEHPSAEERGVKGYRLWCDKKGETREDYQFDIDLSRGEAQGMRILFPDLEPCKEYIFRAVSYTRAGVLGHSISGCFTKSVEIFQRSRGNLVDGRRKRLRSMVHQFLFNP